MARPARPEPKVFRSDEVSARGREWYRETYFGHARSEAVLGEKSTSYLEDPTAPARRGGARRTFVVVLLRDPVQRAVSNWRFSTDNGLETRALEVALEGTSAGSTPGTAADLGLTVRLPGARPLRRLPAGRGRSSRRPARAVPRRAGPRRPGAVGCTPASTSTGYRPPRRRPSTRARRGAGAASGAAGGASGYFEASNARWPPARAGAAVGRPRRRRENGRWPTRRADRHPIPFNRPASRDGARLRPAGDPRRSPLLGRPSPSARRRCSPRRRGPRRCC